VSLTTGRYLLALAVCLAVLLPSSAAAHAILLRTEPASNLSLDRAPGEVRLLFSEPIDASFSHVRVLDATGKPIDRGDSRVDQASENELVVSLLPGLADGVYQVEWRSLSTIDVHPEVGQYPIFIGVPVAATQARAQATSEQNASTFSTTLSRWWLYLTVSVFVGVLAMWRLILGRLLVDNDADRRGVVRRSALRLALIAGALLIIGTLFAAVAQAAAAAGVPFYEGVGTPLHDLLTRGRFANIWWPRLAISLIAVGIVAVRGLDDTWSESAAAMVPAILLTNSLTSHGAALPSAAVGVVADWLHVLGAAVWVGGLASLAVVAPLLRDRPALMGSIAQRFTRMALLAVLVIVASGVLQTVLEVGSWDALVGTGYGLGVLVKIGILAMMLVLALINQRGAGGAWFGRGVRAEFALGVVVLAVAAVVAGTTPARQSEPTSAIAQANR
jgi:copper transport protein